MQSQTEMQPSCFLGLTTGIRAIDLINLKLSDIDWNNETISFKQSKTGNPVLLPLPVSLGNAIARYLSEERHDARTNCLFVRTIAPFDPLAGHTSCYAIVKSVFKAAGISKDARIFGMHMLRHNAASTMVKNEVPVSTIAAILGHANIGTTDIYITTDEKELRECVLPMTGISRRQALPQVEWPIKGIFNPLGWLDSAFDLKIPKKILSLMPCRKSSSLRSPPGRSPYHTAE